MQCKGEPAGHDRLQRHHWQYIVYYRWHPRCCAAAASGPLLLWNDNSMCTKSLCCKMTRKPFTPIGCLFTAVIGFSQRKYTLFTHYRTSAVLQQLQQLKTAWASVWHATHLTLQQHDKPPQTGKRLQQGHSPHANSCYYLTPAGSTTSMNEVLAKCRSKGSTQLPMFPQLRLIWQHRHAHHNTATHNAAVAQFEPHPCFLQHAHATSIAHILMMQAITSMCCT
jgi:hypothetical protein